MNPLKKITNYFFPVSPISQNGRELNPRNLNGYISPVQLQRIRQDVLSWRDAVREAEQAYYPHRVKMQRLFQDTILNGHVWACMQRRKNLTLLKDFKICNKAGIENESLSELFKNKWFYEMLNYILDAQFFGYSLVNLGDVVNDKFNLELIRRHNISPDRENVTAYVYSLSGIQFNQDPEYVPFNIWVTTPTEIGVSPVGYGLLYKIAIYEIFCRNTLAQNGDFTEMFAQPYRVGKTSKTTELERAELESALRNMGSSGYAIIDPTDEIAFLETALGGTGYKAYESLESRCEKKISKLVLGHADAMDSTPGKLGANDAVEDAIREVEILDGRFCEHVINDSLLPKMRELGFNIPIDLCFKFKNDKEKEEIRVREDASNRSTADIVKVLFDAGLKVDPKYITERTNIPLTEIPTPEPIEPKTDFSKEVQNKLKDLYV